MHVCHFCGACLRKTLTRIPPLCVMQHVPCVHVIHFSGQLFPDRAEQILRRVQRPSFLIFDSIAANLFLAGDWNKVVESYRSPWTADTWFKRDGSVSSDDEVPVHDRSQ